MINRIKLIVSHLGLSTRAFAIRCDIKQNTLSNQLNGNRDLSLSTVVAILKAFPEISSEWLIRGEGAMLKTNSTINPDTYANLRKRLNALQNAINDTEIIFNSVNELVE